MVKKYIVPIIVTAIAVIYAIALCIFLFVIMADNPLPIWAVIIILAGPVITAGAIIAVLVMRIKEIKGGEEDVASKY